MLLAVFIARRKVHDMQSATQMQQHSQSTTFTRSQHLIHVAQARMATSDLLQEYCVSAQNFAWEEYRLYVKRLSQKSMHAGCLNRDGDLRQIIGEELSSFSPATALEENRCPPLSKETLLTRMQSGAGVVEHFKRVLIPLSLQTWPRIKRVPKPTEPSSHAKTEYVARTESRHDWGQTPGERCQLGIGTLHMFVDSVYVGLNKAAALTESTESPENPHHQSENPHRSQSASDQKKKKSSGPAPIAPPADWGQWLLLPWHSMLHFRWPYFAGAALMWAPVEFALKGVDGGDVLCLLVGERRRVRQRAKMRNGGRGTETRCAVQELCEPL